MSSVDSQIKFLDDEKFLYACPTHGQVVVIDCEMDQKVATGISHKLCGQPVHFQARMTSKIIAISPQERYNTLLNYLTLKIYEKDWHGVSDAANDIRELIAKHPELEKR